MSLRLAYPYSRLVCKSLPQMSMIIDCSDQTEEMSQQIDGAGISDDASKSDMDLYLNEDHSYCRNISPEEELEQLIKYVQENPISMSEDDVNNFRLFITEHDSENVNYGPRLLDDACNETMQQIKEYLETESSVHCALRDSEKLAVAVQDEDFYQDDGSTETIDDPFDSVVGMTFEKKSIKLHVLRRMLSSARIKLLNVANCVVFFGESGSGKSWFARHVFRYLNTKSKDPVFTLSYCDESSFQTAIENSPSLLLIDKATSEILKLYMERRETLSNVTIIFVIQHIDDVDSDFLSCVDFAYYFGYPTFEDRYKMIESFCNVRGVDAKNVASTSLGLYLHQIKTACKNALVETYFGCDKDLSVFKKNMIGPVDFRIVDILKKEHAWLFDCQENVLLYGKESVLVRKALEFDNVRYIDLIKLKKQLLFDSKKICTAIHFWNSSFDTVFEEMRLKNVVVIASDQFATRETATNKWFSRVVDAGALKISYNSVREMFPDCFETSEWSLEEILFKLKK